MAILGCGDAGGACEPVGRAPAAYESMAQCMAAQPIVLASAKVDYPEVAARCEAAAPASAPAHKAPRRFPVRLASAQG